MSSSSPSLSLQGLTKELAKELWETVLSYLSHHDYEAISLASRQLLSIINNLFTSLTISDKTLPFLPALLLRFPNLTSIKLYPCIGGNLNNLLTLIASYHLPILHSLDLSHQQHGFSRFQGKFPPLKSLNCYYMGELLHEDLLLIPIAFPNLKELDLSCVHSPSDSLEELVLVSVPGANLGIGPAAIADAIRETPRLRSFSISIHETHGRIMITELIHALLSLKCFTCLDLAISSRSDEILHSIANAGLPLKSLAVHSLFPNLVSWLLCATVIKMASTKLGSKNVEKESLVDLPVNYHVKVLMLSRNEYLKDETVKMIVSVCPNLENLDLSDCQNISEGVVVEVFKRCHRICDLNLANCRLTQFQFEFGFEVPTLCILNLSSLMISDEALSAITKSACKVKHLNLGCCNEITIKGVRQAVINCKQLRVISFKSCEKVAADVVDWMVHERPTLRKIVAPPQFHLSESISYGCLLVSDL
ncbi:hypothetical protein PIB30_012790 [Stylosanthes scabra]|uniref:Uncharacterized protein n=1 Tax=Stylosanthes scabra TaxID=79078 RepID=A0ABU6T5X9_9FABA|nr:hypothetical protein [Stylosanthes scabra]